MTSQMKMHQLEALARAAHTRMARAAILDNSQEYQAAKEQWEYFHNQANQMAARIGA